MLSMKGSTLIVEGSLPRRLCHNGAQGSRAGSRVSQTMQAALSPGLAAEPARRRIQSADLTRGARHHRMGEPSAGNRTDTFGRLTEGTPWKVLSFDSSSIDPVMAFEGVDPRIPKEHQQGNSNFCPCLSEAGSSTRAARPAGSLRGGRTHAAGPARHEGLRPSICGYSRVTPDRQPHHSPATPGRAMSA
jgi:hypothetical protein